MSFNENTRVKIPAILHLSRLGYQYLSLSRATWDGETNIFTDIFAAAIARINPELGEEDVKRIYQDVSLALDNEDLGQAFYAMLTATSGTRLIDFKDFNNNSFHVVTELNYKNGEDEFRPDVILLINGMPLAFIEVKKPNNHDGILAERERINARFKNKKFRKFINISQVLVFSNNMEYDPDQIEPIQGVFYSTTSHSEANFNYFREEETFDLAGLLKPEDDELENFVLKDNNLITIKHSPEFATNKDPDAPTNRVLTSLFNRERLAMLLRYGIAYVKSEIGVIFRPKRYHLFSPKVYHPADREAPRNPVSSCEKRRREPCQTGAKNLWKSEKFLSSCALEPATGRSVAIWASPGRPQNATANGLKRTGYSMVTCQTWKPCVAC